MGAQGASMNPLSSMVVASAVAEVEPYLPGPSHGAVTGSLYLCPCPHLLCHLRTAASAFLVSVVFSLDSHLMNCDSANLPIEIHLEYSCGRWSVWTASTCVVMPMSWGPGTPGLRTLPNVVHMPGRTNRCL